VEVAAPGDYTVVHKTAVAQLNFLCDIMDFDCRYTVLDNMGPLHREVSVSLVTKHDGLIFRSSSSIIRCDSADEAKNKAARDMLDWIKIRIDDRAVLNILDGVDGLH
jgi:hypothetical protein